MATKVKIVGFEMKLAKGLTFFDLFQAARVSSGKETKINGRVAYSLCDRVDDYMAGMVLYYKGDKKSLTTMKDDQGNLLVEKSTLKEGQHSTEATLFCVNPKSLRGVLYQYSGALSASGFYKLLREAHDRVVHQKIKDKVNELTNFGMNNVDKDKARKKAKAMFGGRFRLDVLLTKLDIKEIAKRLDRLDSIQIRAMNALDDAPYFSPIMPWSRSANVTVALQQPKDRSAMLKSLDEVIKSIPMSKEKKAIKLIGKNFRGEDDWFYIGDNLSHFGTLTFDEYVDQLPSTLWANYPKSEAMDELKNVLRDHQLTFGILPLAKDWPIAAINSNETETA